MTGEMVAQSAGRALDLHPVEATVVAALQRTGLPVDGVFTGLAEREAVADNFLRPLARLEPQQIARSLYLSKFLAAVVAGLFDAALNYLWDETISELRRRVCGYDLTYFFDLAVTDPNRRRKLSGEEDLKKVEDSELIKAARDMGLISDVGYQQLDLIRYMRNHASAAHPNQASISGLQLVGWLDTCIREVITLPENQVVVTIRRLLANLKSNVLTDDDVRTIGASFADLPAEQADNLVNGLFGIYTNLTSTPPVLDNVRKLLPWLWPHIGEATRHSLGMKYGRYATNNDADQARLAREFLDTVAASAYLPANLRYAEIDRAVDELLTAHRGWNNFYTEPPLARALAELVGQFGDIPAPLRVKYVHALVELFLSNGSGIAYNADPTYRELLTRLDVPQAEVALAAFADPVIAARLQHPTCQKQWHALLDLLEPKITSPQARARLTAVRAFPASPDKLAADSDIRRTFGLTAAR